MMWRVFVLAAILLVAPAVARAQCSVSATPVSFGTYLPFSASPTDSTGSVTVGCLFIGPYSIALNAGLNGGGNFANRRMTSGGALMFYQLYTNATRTTVWGDGTGGSSVATGFCVVVCSNPYTVYGRIPARQTVRPGTYVDTIVVTVRF